MGLFAFLVIGADQRNPGPMNKVTKKSCRGYTVIEASLGIDCNGDTLQLRKVSGYFERVRQDDTKSGMPVSVN